MKGTVNAETGAIPVSVVMPFHRIDPYLFEAIESIRASQGVSLDYILVADLPVVDQVESLRSKYASDKRIRFAVNSGIGVVAARNTGLSLARHDYVAVMDSDDISAIDRLRKQSEFLARNPSCVAIGSAIRYICEHGSIIGIRTYPKIAGLQRSKNFPLVPLVAAPTVMYRKKQVLAVGGYRAEFGFADDHDLWNRLQQLGDCLNTRDVLLSYRIHSTQTSALHARSQTADTFKSNVMRVLQVVPKELIPVTSASISKVQISQILAYLKRLKGSQHRQIRRVVGFFLIRNWRALQNPASLLKMAGAFWFQATLYAMKVVLSRFEPKSRAISFDRCHLCRVAN